MGSSYSQTTPGVPVGGPVVIHAGRFAERMPDARIPADCLVFAEGDDSSKLAAALDEASALVVLDPAAFPLESLDGERLEILPLAVAADAKHDLPLFERIGFFDWISAPDSALWRDLSEKHGWAASQRIDPGSENLAEISTRLVSLLRNDPNLPHHKAVHHLREEALRRRFAATNRDAPSVLEICVGDGRWAMSFDPAKARYVGLCANEDDLRAARRDLPEQRFDLLETERRFPHDDESFDFVFGVDSLQGEPPEVRKRLLSEMWRVAKPGGNLVFIEDFVFEDSARRKPPPMTAPEFAGLAMDATDNRVVLDHVESLRYPGEDMVRGGVVSLFRLGATSHVARESL